MHTLFPLETGYPTGFSYLDDFISAEEEMEYLKEILKLELKTFNFQGFEARRKTASFGFDYSFQNKSISRGKDIPPFFKPVIHKLANHLSIASDEIAELLITEYPAGAVINWHRDAPPFDLIAGISLLTDCSFRLRPYEKAKQSRSSIITIPVKRRSLYIMQGEARAAWQHSISPVKQVRYSITFRTLKHSIANRSSD